MITYDVTNTAIATSDKPIRLPSDGELFTITVALLMYSDRRFRDLDATSLELTQRSCCRVAQLIEERTPSLAREFGTPVGLRSRLRELIGLRVSRRFLA